LKELSIFIDESGDFGPLSKHTRYYIVALVFHEQQNDLTPLVSRFKELLRNCGHDFAKAIRTGPLIRREEPYHHQAILERRRQFFQLVTFVKKAPLTHKTFVFNKKVCGSGLELAAVIEKEIEAFINLHFSYFQSFDDVKIYYDNGQVEIKKIIRKTLGSLFFHPTIRSAMPNDYFLLQVADYFCTIELLKQKLKCSETSKSEMLFFSKPKELQKLIRMADEKKFSLK